MGYPDNHNSWDDAIYSAPTRKDRAWVYLQRALGRGSKRLIASDIDRALSMLYSSHDAMSYIAEHKLPTTQRGLHTAARRLLESLTPEEGGI